MPIVESNETVNNQIDDIIQDVDPNSRLENLFYALSDENFDRVVSRNHRGGIFSLSSSYYRSLASLYETGSITPEEVIRNYDIITPSQLLSTGQARFFNLPERLFEDDDLICDFVPAYSRYSNESIRLAARHYHMYLARSAHEGRYIIGFYIPPVYFIDRNSRMIVRCGPWMVCPSSSESRRLDTLNLLEPGQSTFFRGVSPLLASYHHPHININGEICWGTEYSRAQSAQSNGDLLGLLSCFESTVRSHNPDDAFNHTSLIERFTPLIEIFDDPSGTPLIYWDGVSFNIMESYPISFTRSEHQVGPLKLMLSQDELRDIEGHKPQFFNWINSAVRSVPFILMGNPDEDSFPERARMSGFSVRGGIDSEYPPTQAFEIDHFANAQEVGGSSPIPEESVDPAEAPTFNPYAQVSRVSATETLRRASLPLDNPF